MSKEQALWQASLTATKEDHKMIPESYIEVVESEAETCDSDDSQEDPSFDILEETRSKFSNLSLKKKSRSCVPVKMDEEVDCIEIVAPELDANDQKSFEVVQKIIEDCQVEKLKVVQCKLYLRKHGLRLTGKKDVLINRIKEHISILNEGEHKYPASSFIINCKGDACTGDIVMFEQNVYEMFSIASRSATGPPCGKRVVAGRIVKESYGAAKQQHTFTIEVLWSKGDKPLPPLHPLLIKGRNLYRLKTMRQRWDDESQRQKILSEKHIRGDAARTNREARLRVKEMKKAPRPSKGNIQNENQEKKPINSRNPTMQDLHNTSVRHEAINLPIVSNPHSGVGVLGNRPLMTNMIHHGGSYKENINLNILRGPIENDPLRKSFQVEQNMGLYHSSRQFDYDARAGIYHPHGPSGNYGFQQGNNNRHLHQGQRRQQVCRYYAQQGRCHYGANCKYLH